MPVKTVSIDAVQVDGFKIEVCSRGHVVMVDQPTSGGGTDAGPTPLEYLFVSLAGCIVTIGNIIARQRRLPVRGIQASVEGELDTDVLMGKSNQARAGFSTVRVRVNIDADMSHAEKEQFLRDIDARCPISDNVANLTPIELVVEQDSEHECYGSSN